MARPPDGLSVDSSATMAEEIQVREPRDRADYDACVSLQRAVWGMSELEINSTIQLIATVHAGGTLHLAEAPDGEIVGFAYGFVGLRAGVPHLHSDLLAVLPRHRGQGLGARLKWAQRDAALARGLGLITWTFDPLQARNAHLNLRRLGGVAGVFLPNLYGPTNSPLHHGLPTDRLEIRWELSTTRVETLAREGAPPGEGPAPSLPCVNEVAWKAGSPVSSAPRLDLDSPQLLLEIPVGWDGLCRDSPPLAAQWQGTVKEVLVTYLGRGYEATDFVLTREGDRRRALYVLSRRPDGPSPG